MTRDFFLQVGEEKSAAKTPGRNQEKTRDAATPFGTRKSSYHLWQPRTAAAATATIVAAADLHPRSPRSGASPAVRTRPFARSFVPGTRNQVSYLSQSVSVKLCDPLSNQVRIQKNTDFKPEQPFAVFGSRRFCVVRARRGVRFGSTRILAAGESAVFSLGRKLHKNTRTHTLCNTRFNCTERRLKTKRNSYSKCMVLKGKFFTSDSKRHTVKHVKKEKEEFEEVKRARLF